LHNIERLWGFAPPLAFYFCNAFRIFITSYFTKLINT